MIRSEFAANQEMVKGSHTKISAVVDPYGFDAWVAKQEAQEASDAKPVVDVNLDDPTTWVLV